MDHIKTTIHTFNELADRYAEKYMDVSSYHASLNLFLDNLSGTQSSILEIGCGPGNLTKYLLSKQSHLKVHGIDLAPNMLKIARLNNPTASYSLMDARDISQLPAKYDAVVAGFCMPYLSNPEGIQLLKDVYHLLNPNGIVYFSTMEGKKEESGYETSSDGNYQAYIYYHEELFLNECLMHNGFDLIKLYKLPTTNSQGRKLNDLVYIAKKRT